MGADLRITFFICFVGSDDFLFYFYFLLCAVGSLKPELCTKKMGRVFPSKLLEYINTNIIAFPSMGSDVSNTAMRMKASGRQIAVPWKWSSSAAIRSVAAQVAAAAELQGSQCQHLDASEPGFICRPKLVSQPFLL